ncbi:family 10 glycosylhydrolase [candidate division KSB1 bacterium]|nr:family 10 glycosylhydrolase [candidate division KSB1 bacterium]
MLLSLAASPQTLEELRAVKITNVDSDVLFSDAAIAEAMDYLASIGINTILAVVWNGHGADGVYTLYPSHVMDKLFGAPMHPAFPRARDPLKRLIIEAHRNGMEVLPWFEMGFSTSYSQNGGYILASFPAWALKNNQGQLCIKNGFDWMSAINPDIQNFILALTTEVIDTYDVDGVEYSDRIPAMPVEGGYDSTTVAIYRAEHNGALPPQNYRDSAWKRWRADKLTQFYRMARDSIKVRGKHYLVSSSPSVYPWSYDEYLQDSKTWLEQGIIDNLIPQLYRYNIEDYLFECDKTLGYYPADRRHLIYAGILLYLRGENYLITPQFLSQTIQANRDRNLHGEAFFFYQGLRLNNNQLGNHLRQKHYSQPAITPLRNGHIWRPKASVVNEDDMGVKTMGDWSVSDIAGFKPNILINKDARHYAEIQYTFSVAFSAWYDVFAYIVTGPKAATHAPYTLYSEHDSIMVTLNQTDYYGSGWQYLHTVYLSAGEHTVVKLSNLNIPFDQYTVADAMMIMLNRKKSPEVIITKVDTPNKLEEVVPGSLFLSQNYPNPFNATTRIFFTVPQPGWVKMNIFDIMGKHRAVLVDERKAPGVHSVRFDGSHFPSGSYFYRLQVNGLIQTKSLVIIQ